jgi:amino acid adenylation domain-containing protein
MILPEDQFCLPNPSELISSKWFDTIQTRFSQQAQRVPDQVAVVDSFQAWTYAELDKLSSQLANYLRTSGIQSQDVVAIYAHRSAELVWAILGILKAGAAFLILDAKYPASRLIDCSRLAMPKGLLIMETAGNLSSEWEVFLHSQAYHCCLKLPQGVIAASNALKGYSSKLLNWESEPDHLAYIAFTSGSTGKPKGILGTHSPVSHFLEWHIQTFDLQASDRFCMLSGLSHDPLLRDIFTPLSLGATLYIPDTEKMLTSRWLATWMNLYRISIVHLTPAINQILCGVLTTDPGTTCVSLRYAFFGGAILTGKDVALVRSLAPNVICINFYGATETPQAMGYYIVPETSVPNYEIEAKGSKSPHVQDQTSTRIPVGRGIWDVQLLILNDSLHQAGMQELGEIYIRTPYLAKGYLGDENITKERFIPNPFTNTTNDRFYKTGDLGRYNTDGTISLAGRVDNQVKIRGFRVELEEIEIVLNSHPALQQAIVVAQEDIMHNQRLIAYVVSVQSPVDISELRLFLREKLPDYMVPAIFTQLSQLPLNLNGKVDRQALLSSQQANLDVLPQGKESFVAPRNVTEHQLVKIWESLLGVKPIGIRDNYFDIGGNSLLAVNLFTEIEQVFCQQLPINVLLELSTIEQLARSLDEQQSSAPKTGQINCLLQIQPGSNRIPPLFCVHEADGHILCYRELAKHLGNEQTVYGLQPYGINGKNPLYRRLEDMATHFIQEIRALQPEGPYFLCGLCVGGIIAYEIAVQLQAQGQRVALLALFDAALEQSPTLSVEDRLNRHLHKFFSMNLQEKLGYTFLKIKGKIQRTVRPLLERITLIQYQIYLKTGRYLPFWPRKVPVREILSTANYKPQIYSGQATLFRATEGTLEWHNDPALGWGDLVMGGVETYDIPSRHNEVTDMLAEPYVRVLAEKLRACIDRACVSPDH